MLGLNLSALSMGTVSQVGPCGARILLRFVKRLSYWTSSMMTKASAMLSFWKKPGYGKNCGWWMATFIVAVTGPGSKAARSALNLQEAAGTPPPQHGLVQCY